jgi:hypothetical protein
LCGVIWTKFNGRRTFSLIRYSEEVEAGRPDWIIGPGKNEGAA